MLLIPKRPPSPSVPSPIQKRQQQPQQAQQSQQVQQPQQLSPQSQQPQSQHINSNRNMSLCSSLEQQQQQQSPEQPSQLTKQAQQAKDKRKSDYLEQCPPKNRSQQQQTKRLLTLETCCGYEYAWARKFKNILKMQKKNKTYVYLTPQQYTTSPAPNKPRIYADDITTLKRLI
ncbi:unnamed protein product [Absidia cylindrospora]